MFYDQLKKLCDEKGVKITPLVKTLGMSTSGVKRWQDGVYPNGETLLKFSEYFGVSTDFLLTGRETPTTNTVHAVNNGNSVGVVGQSNAPLTIHNGKTEKESEDNTLSEEERELLRIYKNSNVRTRMKLLEFAFGLDESIIHNN